MLMRKKLKGKILRKKLKKKLLHPKPKKFRVENFCFHQNKKCLGEKVL